MAKKDTKTTKKEAKKEVVNPEPKPKAKKATVKEPLKKVTTKKVKSIAAKPEPKKVTTKKVEKIAVKPEPKKVTTKKVEKIAVKPEPKKVAMKKEEKKVVKKMDTKKEVKKTVKKTEPKKSLVSEKKTYYDAMSMDDCIKNMQKMNVHYQYEDYAQLLTDESDHKQLIQNILEGNHIKDLTLDYKTDGYDQDLVEVTLKKVKDSIDLTPADFKNLKQEIASAMKFKMGEDGELNAAEYLKEFHLCERISMLAKRKHIESLDDMNALLKSDISEFTKHFMDFAYAILPTWKYKDVVFYEDFMYSYVSLFDELYLIYEQRIQLDCADLYIHHGDHDRGNAEYDYLLRENQLKDYIYYRFAHAYENMDLGRAKEIAQSALQYVDDRYVYYPNIIEILNK